MTDTLQEFIEHCPDAFVIVDDKGRIEMFNRLAEQLFGYPRDEVIGQPIEVLIPQRFRTGHIAHRSGYLTKSTSRPMGSGMELVGQRKDGSEFPVEISLSPMVSDEGTKAVSAVRDITERRQTEESLRNAKEAAENTLADLTAAKESLVQAEKMASLGQLTAGIAHEIKNPLNFVNNFAETSVELLSELSDVIAPALASLEQDACADAEDLIETLRADLATIARHGARADGIMRSMLAHARDDDTNAHPTDLNKLVEEAYNLAYHAERASHPEFTVTLETAFDPTVGEIDAYPEALMRVLVNLLSNSFHATQARKAAAANAYAPAVHLATKSQDDHVTVSVRDNGIGMTPDVQKHLFTPFFTTKAPGKGTGLGLSISYDTVVHQHGGTIHVDSRPNGHTVFEIVLPRQTPRNAGAADEVPAK